MTGITKDISAAKSAHKSQADTTTTVVQPRAILIAREHKITAHKSGALIGSPDLETVIKNPRMSGARPDYKATALALADQLLDAQSDCASKDRLMRDAFNQLNLKSRTIGELYDERANTRAALISAFSHWSSMFWTPKVRAAFKAAGFGR